MKKLFLFIFILLFLFSCSSNKQEEEIKVSQEEIQDNTKQEFHASLIMAGDALCHESIFLEHKNDDSYDFRYIFDNIKPLIKNYDIAYYNQETVLGGDDYEITGYPVFNTPKEVGDALIDAGFNLVSLASNHLLDFYNIYGNKLILNQINYFKGKNNVIASGSYESKEDRDNIVIGQANGITYALLSYTYGSNTSGPNSNESYLVNYIDKEVIANDVKKYRDKVDVLLVSMHWGEENYLEENDYQREYAKFLADLDVDIVIGTHPHVLEPIEWIDDTLVIYSLGNLFSNQYFNIDNLSSALISVDIFKTIEDDITSIEINNLKADMIFTDLDDLHKVCFYRDLNEKQLENNNEYYNKYKNILMTYIEDIEIN